MSFSLANESPICRQWKILPVVNYTPILCGWAKILSATICIKSHFQFPGENMSKSHKVVSNLPKCPTQSTLMRQKKIFWKDFIQGWIFTRAQAHCERRFTVCSQSGMEMEPKHFKAILMRTLALKNLQTHCFHSQDTSRRKEQRPEGNHICKKPEAWEDSWQTSMQVLARNSTNQFK